MGIWIVVNVFALMLGAVIIGDGPTISYDIETVEEIVAESVNSSKLNIVINDREVPLDMRETKYVTKTTCQVVITLDYRLMVAIDKSSVVIIDGSCDTLDVVENYPSIQAIIRGWGM